MIKGRIDGALKDYFYNYDPNSLDVGFFSGKVNLRNLYFNTEKINNDLKLADVPLRMKVGLLSDMLLEISLFSLKLETLSITDLVIVMEPYPSHLSNIETEEDISMKEQYIVHLLQNLEKYRNGETLNKPGNFMTPEHQELMKNTKIGAKMLSEAKAGKQKKIEDQKKEGFNILGPELWELILGRIDFKIKIQNIKIYLEFEKEKHPLIKYDDSFSVLFQLKELSLCTVGS